MHSNLQTSNTDKI